MSPAGGISDHEESFSQMDEDEWTDRNFGASTAEIGSSDEDSSESDSDSDDEVFEEALEEPATKEGTQRIAKEWVKRYSKDQELDDDSCSPEDYDTGSDFSYENSSDDDESDTATEGEEEIRARELRKQEVRVKQPIVQTDTGSDTEVKNFSLLLSHDSSDHHIGDVPPPNVVLNGCPTSTASTTPTTPDVVNTQPEQNTIIVNGSHDEPSKNTLPDILSNSQQNDDDSADAPQIISVSIPVRKVSQDNTSAKNSPKLGRKTTSPSLESASAKNSPKPSRKSTSPLLNNASAKNSPKPTRKVSQNSSCNSSPTPVCKFRKFSQDSTSTSASSIKNFIKQKSFDQATPAPYIKPDNQPLLIIKRTPSKINVPKEPQVLAKPRIASLASIEHAKKYFGNEPPASAKPQIRRPPAINRAARPKTTIGLMTEQKETPKAKIEATPSFEFEPQDDDLKDIDTYIENLLAKEDELLIPIVVMEESPHVEEKEEETPELSESIEDLLKALEIETGLKDTETPEEVQAVEPITAAVEQEKIDDLLNWITELEHQPKDQKLFRSYSGVKYKNLERVLKTPQRSESVVSRLPKDNINFFERRFSGIQRYNPDLDNSLEDITNECRNFQLTKSKTDVYCNKQQQPRASVDLEGIKIDIKGKLSMFEKKDDDNKPPVKLSKSHSMKSSSVSPSRTFANNKMFIKQLSSNSDDLSDDNLVCVKTFNNTNNSGKEIPPDNNVYFSAQVNCIQKINYNQNGLPPLEDKPDISSLNEKTEISTLNEKKSEVSSLKEKTELDESHIITNSESQNDEKHKNDDIKIDSKTNEINHNQDAEKTNEAEVKLELDKSQIVTNSESQNKIQEDVQIESKADEIIQNPDFKKINGFDKSEAKNEPVSLKTLLQQQKQHQEPNEVNYKTEATVDLKTILTDNNQKSLDVTNKEPVYATVNKELKKKSTKLENINLDYPQVPLRTKKTPVSPALLSSTHEGRPQAIYENGLSLTENGLSPTVKSKSRDVSPSRAKIHDMKLNFLDAPANLTTKNLAKSDSNILQSVSDTSKVQPKIPTRKKSNTSAPSPILNRPQNKSKPDVELKPELPPRKRTSSYAIRQHGSKELNDAISQVHSDAKKEAAGEKKIVKAAHKDKTNKDKDCVIQ